MSDDFFISEGNAGDPMRTGGEDGIRLPFSAPLLSWRNGNAALSDLGDENPKYTGGWEMSKESWEKVKADVPPLPALFKLYALRGKETYDAFLAKQIVIFPVGLRERALMKLDGRDVPVKRFTKGSRQHIQMLAYLATVTDGGGFKPWGPVVLSAKSNSAMFVKQCFEDFKELAKKELDNIRVPYHRFWLRIGTPIPPKFVTVGKGGDTSDVTPCYLMSPQGGWTLDALKHAYIGADMIAKAGELQMLADAWLNDKQWVLGTQAAPAVNNPLNLDDEPEFMRG